MSLLMSCIEFLRSYDSVPKCPKVLFLMKKIYWESPMDNTSPYSQLCSKLKAIFKCFTIKKLQVLFGGQ